MQPFYSGTWRVLALLTGLSLVMRFFSFFPSVIDHDESTYILIADAMLHGKVYYRDVFDTKPVGIFTLFACFEFLAGKSIFAIRVIAAMWVALTAWMIFLAHRQLVDGKDEASTNPAPLASSIIYVFLTSVYTFYGISPNTELFFNLFTIASLYIILRYERWSWFLAAGFLLGIGFVIKYVVAFDAIALGFFYLWRQVRTGKPWSYWLQRCTWMAAGFLLPFVATWFYYIQKELGDTFWFYSFELSGRYFVETTWIRHVTGVTEFFLRYLPVTIWFFFCLWDWRKVSIDLTVLGIWWGILIIWVVLLPGKHFFHYYIQFMLPYCLVAGSFFDPRRTPGRLLSWMRNPTIGYPLILVGICVNIYFQKLDYYDKPDYPKAVAAYLNTRLQPGDLLYTGNFHPIVYFLTNTHSPTPYVHRSLLREPSNLKALKLDQASEFEKIMSQHPRFVLIALPLTEDNPLYPYLRSSYSAVKTFDTRVAVYERIE